MALEQQIQKDIVEAMKAKDQTRLNTVRSIKSAILLAKTAEGGSKELQDGDIFKIIQKLVKQHKETAEQFIAAGRQDAADKEMAEASILDAYLPKQLSAEEIEQKLKEIISSVGATGIADMGKVMGVATKMMAGLADGKAISAAVRKLLS
ncbi:MAG: GatB/YqeY domain-containing protein [Bacteroidaceae bacterium]|nr:GatB/YqeY domain-containing protein [Bacteroidaceae bacterium]